MVYFQAHREEANLVGRQEIGMERSLASSIPYRKETYLGAKQGQCIPDYLSLNKGN